MVTHILLISGRLKAELLRQVFDRDNEANEIMMSAIEGRYNQVSQYRIRFDNARNLTAEDIHHIRYTNGKAIQN